MRRSEDDVLGLLGDRPNFRLCKGIYREKKEIAFQTREEVQQNFIRLLDLMLKREMPMWGSQPTTRSWSMQRPA